MGNWIPLLIPPNIRTTDGTALCRPEGLVPLTMDEVLPRWKVPTVISWGGGGLLRYSCGLLGCNAIAF